MSALRIHSLPHSICLKNVSVQKVKDIIQYLSFQTDLWICGTGGGMGRQCRKRWESARKKDFSAHSLVLPGPGCVLYLNNFSRSCGCDATVYTLITDPKPHIRCSQATGHRGANATSQWQQTRKWEVPAKLWLSSINIFISLSLPLRCWDLCLPCSLSRPKGVGNLHKIMLKGPRLYMNK